MIALVKRRRINQDSIPEKANRILNGILVVLLLILFRVWHVAVVQHDEKKEEARRPQERLVIEKAERATICDRFGIPLATNRVQYNISISYGGIRELPRWIWKKNEEGRRSKYFVRKEYISSFAEKLSAELHLDSEWIEDLIHSKAAILGNVPCLLKENISEREYFRLKMLEKEWPGIQAEIAAKRHYPQGLSGGEVVGYIGPISREEYLAITEELQELTSCIAQAEEGELPSFPKEYETIEEVKQRRDELEKKAYSLNDFVGKMGVEAAFDAQLRGVHGRRLYLSDTRGNHLFELPGSEPPLPGKRIKLTLSAELQAYAEQLLAEYEALPGAAKWRSVIPENQPWIKGGALVVMDPHTGEIYALASSPRFDPNDFIRTCDPETRREKNSRVNQWLESDEYIESLWDLKFPLTRERFDSLTATFYEEQIDLTWDVYLSSLLPPDSLVRHTLEKRGTISDALWVQRKTMQLIGLFQSETLSLTPAKIFDSLYQGERSQTGVLITLQEREFFEQKMGEVKAQIETLQDELAPYFQALPLNYEKLLLVDLYRLAVDESRFSSSLEERVGTFPLKEYREASARFVSVNEGVKEIVELLYNQHDFKEWREEEFAKYLAQKREEEKRLGRKYAKPYLDYLAQAQKERFNAFWEKHNWKFLKMILTEENTFSSADLLPYTETLMSWSKELAKGAHRGLSWVHSYHRLKELCAKVPLTALLKTMRPFSKLERPLLGRYLGLRGSLEKHLASAFYPTYGYGFARSHAFRQAATIGSIFKLIPAYEALRQRYERNYKDLNPLTIVDDKQKNHVGYTLDGRAIPLYYHGGRLPRSDHTGVGKVDLIGALERSSNPYFALIAGEILEDPEDLCHAARLFGFGGKTGIEIPGEYGGRIPEDITYNRTGLYSMAIGQHSLVGTPLQAAVMLCALANGGEVLKPKITLGQKEVRWNVFLPRQIQDILLQGLKQVVVGEKGTARALRLQFNSALVNQIIGKTSTAEVVKCYSLDGTAGRLKTKDVWFASITYETEDFSKPELIVVVYLKHGEWGNDAAPLVGKTVTKWREIKSKYSN